MGERVIINIKTFADGQPPARPRHRRDAVSCAAADRALQTANFRGTIGDKWNFIL